MPKYEYSVIPAPKRGLKGKGIKGAEAQFANALTKVMNEASAEGWEYLRAETLPSEERQGLTGRTTVFQNVLVFRRPLLDHTETNAPSDAVPPPLEEIAEPEPLPALEAPETQVEDTPETIEADAEPIEGEPLELTEDDRKSD